MFYYNIVIVCNSLNAISCTDYRDMTRNLSNRAWQRDNLKMYLIAPSKPNNVF